MAKHRAATREIDPDSFIGKAGSSNPDNFPIVPRNYLDHLKTLARPTQMPWDLDAPWKDTFLCYLTERDHFLIDVLLEKENDRRKEEGVLKTTKKDFIGELLRYGALKMIEEKQLGEQLPEIIKAHREKLARYRVINGDAVDRFTLEKLKRETV